MTRPSRTAGTSGGVRRWISAATGALALAAGLLTVGAPTASAAALTQVSSFGSNPGNLSMYEYAPDGLATGRPLVMALHGCTQTATDYHTHSGWAQYADQYKFAVVYPQTSSSNQSLSCFRWYDPAQSTRGNGEALSIKQMVDKAIAQYGSDARRIYITGLSAGGGQAANLLADYPDVFAGGSIASGLPAQCATSSNGTNACQYGSLNLTPAQWGDKVRNSYPGWTGAYPRVAIWQGSSDYTVYPVNSTELRDQWTNAWGISQTASSTQTLTGKTTLTSYNDANGKAAVQLYSIDGMGHGLAVNPGSGTGLCGSTGAYFLGTICSSYYTAAFWGLDGSGSTTTLPAPSGLAVTGTTSSSATLSWSAVSGAASYNVYRGGAKVGSSTSAGYTDSGLTASTSYAYTVAAVDPAGTVGTASAAVTATTAAASGGTTLPAPTGLAVTGTTSSSATLSWSAVSGAASYNVYRGGAKVGSSTSAGYTDSGLTASTSYAYTVAAVDPAGTVGTASAAVTATTAAVYTPQCFTASNYAQVTAGRAHTSGGYTYANGSEQNMGLYNLFVTHTLKETADGYYVISDSGC
ncbi:PHB depolymerase family esterase [Streptomyces sp. TLI_171]|uniref:extracellular catalytic domain type 1 short-chain-length polyhydroxyalkanoate depolymerase n=1 Tax=Streptomyces sp. TLI_171 TaxID=1938859 RepID=UPI000C18C671|nr:PHB depolymerase family esterase [Streptomyces sp. TLI_171]RKE17294.1 poly(hydroxyalkanoate) depolymerase family esterase [Streptomyces sp. TLI_171]